MSTAILTGPPVAGAPLEGGLRSLGFDVRVAEDAAGVEAALAAVPAGERVALVDPRFVGHTHSLRLALTDPRFPAAAIPGALAVQPTARAALVRAVSAAYAASAPSAPPAAG
ncbi:CDP-alcohol phosphatidyltransferase family protein, partial [Streptomyces chitinivorans]